jgi:hypothetical protein
VEGEEMAVETEEEMVVETEEEMVEEMEKIEAHYYANHPARLNPPPNKA